MSSMSQLDIKVLSAAPKTFSEAEKDALFYLLSLLNEYSKISRKEGLLTLEECICNLPADSFVNRHIAEAIILIVDGVDPEAIEGMLGSDVLLFGTETFEGYLQYIIMKGTLSIQAGVNPHLLRQILIHMLPENIRIEADEHIDRAEEKAEQEYYERCLDRVIMNYPVPTTEPYLPSFCDIIMKLSDKQIKRGLMEISYDELSNVLAFVPAEVRDRFFQNVSHDYRKILVEEMNNYDEKKLSMLMKRIVNIFCLLEQRGEV